MDAANIWGSPVSHPVASCTSGRSKGRHRKKTHRIQPYTWLGAGAITLGVGAALVSGAGIAHAEEESGGGSSSTSNTANSPGSESPSGGSVNSGPAQQRDDNPPTPAARKVETETQDQEAPDRSSNGSSGVEVKNDTSGSPRSIVSASSVVVKAKDDESVKQKESSDDPVAATTLGAADHQAVKDVESLPVLDSEPQPQEVVSQTAAALRVSSLRAPSPLRASSTNGDGQPAGVRTLALMATAAAVDPVRAAYIKQFKDADPNGLYFTPASDGYQFVPQTYTDAQYRQFIADQVAKTGTKGFTQTSSGTLQYTNTYTQNVAVLYGPKAGGVAEPSGIRIVRPGQSVVLPSGTQGAIASAQLPRTGTQINEVAVAAVGYPPFTRTPQTPPNIITTVATTINNAVASGVQAINTALNATVQFVKNAIHTITTPPAQQAPVGVGALFDRLRTTTGDYDDDGVHVDRILGANDGETRYIVYLGGTIPFSIDPNQQNAFRNGDSYAGRLKPNQIAAIDRAIGSNKGAKVMLVGYSQGGLDAQNIAASGKYNVTTVITYGAPITKSPPTKYRIIHLEADGDPIPDLSNPFEHFNSVKAGNVYSTRTSTYPNDFAVFFTPLILRPILFVNTVHGPIQTYVEAGNKFESAAGYGAVKSNIANFRGKLEKSFN